MLQVLKMIEPRRHHGVQGIHQGAARHRLHPPAAQPMNAATALPTTRVVLQEAASDLLQRESWPAADVEFLLDALSRPQLHGEAQRIFAAGVAAGALSEPLVRCSSWLPAGPLLGAW